MYSFNIEPNESKQPPIKRRMVADSPIQLLPVVVEICKAEFGWTQPVAVYMGNNNFRVFDLFKPNEYADVVIVGDLN